MVLRHRFLAETYVTLRTLELRIFLAAVELEIQRATIISCGRDVTAVSAAARSHRHPHSFHVKGIEAGASRIVAIQTAQIRVLASFMTKRPG